MRVSLSTLGVHNLKNNTNLESNEVALASYPNLELFHRLCDLKIIEKSCLHRATTLRQLNDHFEKVNL